MSQNIGIPGIVRDGVVVPQTNETLPEGAHVEIRLLPADIPQSLQNEIQSWERASDESWNLIDEFEAEQQ